ncbi:MAG: DUF222 domain-containing protein [Pseudomonadales bacterium]
MESLIAEIVDLCAHMHRAEHRLLTLIRRLDSLNGWNAEMPSCAHWLNARCGLDLVTAREKVRVAHALTDLPLVDQAFRTGLLSYSKVRAVTRIATPADEAELVDIAASTTAAHVEQYVRSRRQAGRLADPRAAFDAYQRRSFTCRTEEDGSLIFEGRLPADQGAMLMLALDRAMEWVYRESAEPVLKAPAAPGPTNARGACCRRADEHPFKGVSHPARRADALAALAERFLATPPTSDEGLRSADRYQVILHASAESLVEHGVLDPADPPHMEDGPVVAGETVRRLTCDAAIVRLIETGEGEPLDVGRKTRVISPALRRAVKRRDPHCRFPGCTHMRHWEGHHCRHWADGGPTSLDNVVGVCRFHHRLLHEGGYFVVKDGADFVFCRPDGSMVSPVDASLQQSIARAQRDLTIVHLTGAVEEQRAAYRVSSILRTPDPQGFGTGRKLV